MQTNAFTGVSPSYKLTNDLLASDDSKSSSDPKSSISSISSSPPTSPGSNAIKEEIAGKLVTPLKHFSNERIDDNIVKEEVDVLQDAAWDQMRANSLEIQSEEKSRTKVVVKPTKSKKRAVEFYVEIPYRKRRSVAPSPTNFITARMKKEVVEEKSEMSKKESSSKGKSKAGGKKSKEVVRVVKPVKVLPPALPIRKETVFELFGFPAPPPLTSNPPMIPERLLELKPFQRNTILGSLQVTGAYPNPNGQRSAYKNLRIVLDASCNLHCKGPGQPLFWITQDGWIRKLLKEKYPVSIYVCDKPSHKRTHRAENLQQGEHNYYYGEYVYRGILQVEEGCYNRASVEGKKQKLDCMMAYTSAKKAGFLESWDFTDTSAMSKAQARLAIEEDLIHSRGTSGFLYFEYAGVSELTWQELEVCGRLRDALRRGGQTELKRYKASIGL